MTDDERVGASTRALIDAKIRLDDAIEQYTRAHRFPGEQTALAEQHLHSAVISFFWRMQPHISDDDCWDDLEDIDVIEQDVVYRGVHPQTGDEVEIEGLGNLRKWIDRTTEVSVEEDTPLSSTGKGSKTVRLSLPADAAMNAAKVLEAKFEEFGWDAKREYDEHVDEPTEEDLKWLLEQRGQTGAIENLPGYGDGAEEARADGGEPE